MTTIIAYVCPFFFSARFRHRDDRSLTMSWGKQSLITLRLPTWTSGAERPTRRSSTTSIVTAGSTTRYVLRRYPSKSGSNRDFVYEQRWGDAPVHTIGASLFGAKDGVHFFQEIGYEHYPFVHCPQDDMWQRGRCSCEQDRNFGMWRAQCRPSLRWGSLIFLCLDYHGGWSCLPKWEQALNERQGH